MPLTSSGSPVRRFLPPNKSACTLEMAGFGRNLQG